MVIKGGDYLFKPLPLQYSVSINQDYYILVCCLYPDIGCLALSLVRSIEDPYSGEGRGDLMGLIVAAVIDYDGLDFTGPFQGSDCLEALMKTFLT